MKIAITINTSWNIYNFRLGLIRHLLSEGHQVLAIAPYDDYAALLQEEGCEYHAIKIDNTGSNPIKDLSLYLQLKRIYNKTKPDIIYHYTVKPNIYGSLAAQTLGIPVINNVSGLGTVFLADGITSKIAKLLYVYSFKHVDLAFFQNPEDRDEFRSQINLPQLASDLLPGSGINLSTYNSSTLPNAEAVVFLLVARLIIDKGVVEYLEAAKIVKSKRPNVIFRLLGKLDENHARGIKKSLLDKYTSREIIEYLGEVHDVRPIIDESTCVVLPSYREGTPRTLLEAAAMSRPVITTDVPGCKEVVVDKVSGLLCKVKDCEDLAEKMLLFCALSTSEMIAMGKSGRQLVKEKFDEKLVIDKYMRHTSKILLNSSK